MKSAKMLLICLILCLFIGQAEAQFPMKRTKITDGTGTPSGYPYEVTFPSDWVTDDGDLTYSITSSMSFALARPISRLSLST